MAYMRRSERIKNVVLGFFFGGMLTAGIGIYVWRNTTSFVFLEAADRMETELTTENKFEKNEIEENEKEENEKEENEIEGIQDDLRIQDYSLIEVPSNITTGDFVDVRIKNGILFDKVVLSKKKIVDREGNIIWFEINDIERILMNKAVESKKTKDIKLYTTKYVDPQRQSKAIVTYTDSGIE